MKTGVSSLRVLFMALALGLGAASAGVELPGAGDRPALLLPEETRKAPVVPSFTPDYDLTLETLGARYPFYLRGVDGSDSVNFNLRSNEIAVAGMLDLYYSYSPSLLTDLSHINVLLNDEVVATLPVPREDAGKSLRRKIELPAHILTEFNRLRLQLIGHYTLECEDPLHSSLWASISNQSRLLLDVRKLPLPNDLAILPEPFFDFRDARRVVLPFVLENARDAAVLESAGVVASWFGALAAWRGAEFPATPGGQYPGEGNGVVFIKGTSGSHGLTQISGPTLAIVENPNDPSGKLLVVAGRNDEELKRAAVALTTGGTSFSGASAIVTQIDTLEPRKPYDAPNWVRTDRPVKFGELIPEDALDVVGHNSAPARLPLRLPPDLFGWRAKPVSIDLHYRYTPQAGQANSSLLVGTRDQFLKSFTLHSLDQLPDKTWLQKNLPERDLLPVRAHMEVPLSRLMTAPELEFKFMYEYIKEGECRDAILNNVRGRIDPDSTIDLSGFPQFMPMPNLSAFGEHGFPFTRMADLSETAVVFSNKPSYAELTTYLTLMGRFGESTGYPGVNVSVGFGETGLQRADKDLVVISAGDQSWISSWTEKVPALLSGQQKRFAVSDLLYENQPWVTPDPRQSQRPARNALSYTSAGDNVLFAGFESPITPERSVVLISSNSEAGQAQAVKALLRDEGYEAGLRGSLAVAIDRQITPLLAEYSYSVGRLGPWRWLEWQVAQYWPGLPAPGRLIKWAAVLLALLLAYGILRVVRARRRR